jgi:hypothetical protein
LVIPPPNPLDTVALDRSLCGLGQAQSVHERLAILRQLAEYWHGPIGPGEGFTDDELKGKPAPFPLRWWYQLAGRRENILGGQNKLLKPNQLKLDEQGRVPFYVENQGVYLWSAALQDDDPHVWGRFEEAGRPWSEEDMRLSEFLIGACLFESIMQSPFGATAAWADESTLEQIAVELTPLPLAPWRWPSDPSRFFARNGGFMFASPNANRQTIKCYSIWVGAKTARPLAFLNQIVNQETWEHIAL